jgi:hypothetical protein
VKSADPQTPWALLFGLVTPPSQHGESLPAVPRSLYGLLKNNGCIKYRRAIRDKRMEAETDYLRENGPLLVAQLSVVFGISAESVTNDLRLLESAGTVRCLPGKAPRQWEAAS